MKKKLKPVKKPAKLGFISYLGDTQGCGTIRVIYPYLYLNHFRRKDAMCHSTYLMNYVPDVDWYSSYTFCQFQRSATEAHLQLIKHFKENVQKKYPIPVIYEIDDMLFGIPKWNYASIYYNRSEDIIKRIMESVDGMIVSTAKLKEVYSRYCKKISVVPNHLPKFIWGDIYPKHNYFDEKSKIKILWGGSQNHFALRGVVGDDVKGGDFGDDLLNFIKKTTDKYEWHFVGALPEELKEIKSKIRFHPWQNIFEYPSKLKEISPDICIAPLRDIEFNDCKCIIGNTKIVTKNRIKEVKNVNIGDYIWQESDYKKVYEKIKYERRKTIKIKTYLGFELEGTENHRIRSNNNFKRLDSLHVGDKIDLSFFDIQNDYQYLSAPLFLTKKLDYLNFNDLNEDLLPKIKINERWGRFIGYILGDGHIRTGSGSVGISCDSTYQDVVDDLSLFGKEIGLNQLTYVKKKVKKKKSHGYRDGKGIDIIFNSRNLRWFLSDKIGFSGRYGKNLDVPEVILNSPKSVIKEFIRGLFESDGTVSKDSPQISFVTKHEKLIKQIQFLLLGFNILSRIHRRKNAGRYYYTLILNRQACDIFYKEINFLSIKKKRKLKNIVNKKHSNAFKEWELKDEIIDISYGESDVYDIQVPDGEYYLANGIISHNSNIKSLEYTAIGSVGVYSDVTPYKFMNLRSNTDEEMISHIENLADDIDLRANIFKKDYQRVKSQLWWEENNNILKYINTYLNMFGQRL